MLLDLILQISCCLLLLLEAVIIEHAKFLKMFEKAGIPTKQELNQADILASWGFNPQPVSTLAVSPVLTKEQDLLVYKQSTLTHEHEELFNSLSAITVMDSIQEDVVEIPFEFATPPVEEDSYPDEAFSSWEQVVDHVDPLEVVAGVEEEVIEVEADSKGSEYLTMEDWSEESMPVSVDSTLSATASHKINDGFIGEQLWIVEVVGYEQNYIHVSDGATRTWLNVNKFKNIGKGDILSVLVERDVSDQLYVLDIDTLQQKSNDFAIEVESEMNDEFIDYEMAI